MTTNTERDYGREIDALTEAVMALTARLNAMSSGAQTEEQPHKKVGHVEKMPGMHPDPAIMEIMNRMEDSCGADGSTGRVTYVGVFAAGGRQSSWARNEMNTDHLLDLIENSSAERVLACIGSAERLRLLLAILRKPRTVAQLVGECGFSSSGQVYHHLKPLIAADLVTEDSANEGKGRYIIQPYRVQGIIMLLAGINDMIDGQYRQGEWETDPDEAG